MDSPLNHLELIHILQIMELSVFYFSIHRTNTRYGGYSDISAVSFLSCDKEAIKKHYRDEKHIGYAVFSDYMNDRLKFTHIGNICNHDHVAFEVESWLQKVGTKK